MVASCWRRWWGPWHLGSLLLQIPNSQTFQFNSKSHSQTLIFFYSFFLNNYYLSIYLSSSFPATNQQASLPSSRSCNNMASVTTTTVIGKGLFFLSSPLQVEVQEDNNNNKGIVSILRSESNMGTPNSLRRNLSADLSSRKWLAEQNDFSPSPSISIKKVASSEHLSEISTEEKVEEAIRPGQDDVWMTIQLMTKKEVEKPGSWSSILSQDNPNNNLPSPYVHPLDKRSSSLSEKSLQICTESLGSETGSEGFSNSYPTSDNEEEKEEVVLIQQHNQTSQMEKQQPEDHEWKTTKCMYSTTRTKSTPRSFPPPLPSLSQSDGLTIHMQSHRSHGRLVLEAVSVPSQNFFHAQRQDGRLVLKLNATPNLSDQEQLDDDDHIDEQVSQDFEDHEDEDGEGEDQEDESEVEEIVRQETEVKEVTVLIEQEPRLNSSGGSLNVHRSSIMFKKIMRINNINPAWPNRFNKEVNLARVEMEVELKEEVAFNSLSPVARLIRSPTATTTTVGTTGSFNAYDYFWRTKRTNYQQGPTEKNNNNNILTILPPNGPKTCNRQELVFLRGNKGEYLLPLVTDCKDSRRSLLIWEPYCVASS